MVFELASIALLGIVVVGLIVLTLWGVVLERRGSVPYTKEFVAQLRTHLCRHHPELGRIGDLPVRLELPIPGLSIEIGYHRHHHICIMTLHGLFRAHRPAAVVLARASRFQASQAEVERFIGIYDLWRHTPKQDLSIRLRSIQPRFGPSLVYRSFDDAEMKS